MEDQPSLRAEDKTGAASPTDAIPKLPEANQFSPGQVELLPVLEIVANHPENREEQIEAIRVRYFANHAASQADPTIRLARQRTLAYNVLVGMKGYGLMTFDPDRLTPVGQALVDEPDEVERTKAFAAHILGNCHGLDVLRCVQALQSRDAPVSKATLVDELRRAGFTTLPVATTHHLTLLAWLRPSGVIGDTYDIDDVRIKEIAGVSLAQIDEWESLSRRQQAFLRTLRRLSDGRGSGSIAVKEVLSAAVFEHGPIFRDDQLRADVTRPLEDAGWLVTSGIKPGRGGKSGYATSTPKLMEADFERLTGYAAGEIPPDIRAKLSTPLSSIRANLASEDRGVKGIALEVLAVRLAVDLGLIPLRFRLRSRQTGGAEVDLLAEGAQLHFSRWLFQCKNQKTAVPLSDLAKEVGMATLMHAHVVVLVTTGRFASSVVDYATELAATSPLQVVLVDGRVLREYLAGGAGQIQDEFHRRAQATMRLKRPQVLEAIDEAVEE